ncbi:MAG: transposase [Firmicutes bacterium]|nr:transposase [Bacillota bacterium]
MANIRQDFLHKMSTRLYRENQAIRIETLSVQGMMQNPRFAQVMGAQGFGQFFEMLKYKAERYGTWLVEADRGFPSSKLCSTPGCGYLYKDVTLKNGVGPAPPVA